MTTKLNATSSGLIETVDTSGILEFQTANTSALIIDASQNQIRTVAEFLQTHNQPYTIYLYSEDMDNQDWLNTIVTKADVVLRAKGSTVTVNPQKLLIHFGELHDLTNPVDFFNK